MDEQLTAHQRQCLEHLRRAQALEMPLTVYAREHGIKARMLYDTVVHLRRRGVLAEVMKAEDPGQPRVKPAQKVSPFVAVRVEALPTMADSSAPVLRLKHVGGHVLEFGSWPPAEVLAAALAGGRDVAP